MGAGGTPPVPTFVIGVFAPGVAAQTAQTNLDMLAKAGQGSTTATAVIIDTGQNVATALQNALKAVQSKAIACEYKLPAGGVDFKQVNVSFTSGSGSARPSVTRRSTAPTARAATRAAAGITTRIPPPPRRPRSPPARPAARCSRPT